MLVDNAACSGTYVRFLLVNDADYLVRWQPCNNLEAPMALWKNNFSFLSVYSYYSDLISAVQ